MTNSIYVNKKYLSWYNSIIVKAQQQNRSKSTKYIQHHITPDSFYIKSKRNTVDGWLEGNPNSDDNLVFLTPKEHFVCHHLLTKIFTDQAKKKMCYAFHLMVSTCKKFGYQPTNRNYETALEEVRKMRSKYMTGTKHFAADTKIYKIVNIKTGELFYGDKFQLFDLTHTSDICFRHLLSGGCSKGYVIHSTDWKSKLHPTRRCHSLISIRTDKIYTGNTKELSEKLKVPKNAVNNIINKKCCSYGFCILGTEETHKAKIGHVSHEDGTSFVGNTKDFSMKHNLTANDAKWILMGERRLGWDSIKRVKSNFSSTIDIFNEEYGTFEGTITEFFEKYPRLISQTLYTNLVSLSKTKKKITRVGWISMSATVDKEKSNPPVRRGKLNNNHDNTVYTFSNKEETFSGSFYDLRKKYNLKGSFVANSNKLKNGTIKSICGWSIQKAS